MIHQIQKIHDHISLVYYSETLFESNALRQFLTLINWCIFSAISIEVFKIILYGIKVELITTIVLGK